LREAAEAGRLTRRRSQGKPYTYRAARGRGRASTSCW